MELIFRAKNFVEQICQLVRLYAVTTDTWEFESWD
jgi:hypothetical protein